MIASLVVTITVTCMHTAKDMERQQLNVFRMRLMGAEVRPVSTGTATLKDATSQAIRDWVRYGLPLDQTVFEGAADAACVSPELLSEAAVTNVESTHYILGSAAGPHPYPMMVRDFQSVIGKETREQ
eukprot:scaffold20682_cov24-Tisochrysis_lutea.AAC.1